MLKPADGAYCLYTLLGETLHYPLVYFWYLLGNSYKAHSYLSLFRELKDWALKEKHIPQC